MLKSKKTFLHINLAKLSFSIILILTIVLLYFAFFPMLKSIIIALMLSYLFSPLIKFCKQKNIPKMLSITILFIFLIIALVYLIYIIKLSFPSISKIYELINEVINGIKKLKIVLAEKYSFIDWEIFFDSLISKIGDSSQLTNNFSKLLKNLTSISTMLITIPFATFFFLLDSKKFIDSILKIIPNKYYEITYTTMSEIDKLFGSYIRGTLSESTIISILTFIGLSLIGFPLGLNIIVSIIAGLTNVIPNIGPFFGTLIGLAIYFLDLIPAGFQSFIFVSANPYNIILIYVIVQTIDNILLKPIFLGNKVNLHPMLVVFAVIAGGKLFGFFGILLAIPVLAAIKVLVFTLYSKLKDYQYLSDRIFKITTIEDERPIYKDD